MMLVWQLKLIKTMIKGAGVGKPVFNSKPRPGSSFVWQGIWDDII